MDCRLKRRALLDLVGDLEEMDRYHDKVSLMTTINRVEVIEKTPRGTSLRFISVATCLVEDDGQDKLSFVTNRRKRTRSFYRHHRVQELFFHTSFDRWVSLKKEIRRRSQSRDNFYAQRKGFYPYC
jgi:hypothetical protein